MATVRDPMFWKRFSVAVHQEEAAKEEQASRPELKHSYVNSLSTSELPSPIATPTSQSHLSPAFGSFQPQPLSPVAMRPLSPETAALAQPTAPATPTTPRRLTKSPSVKAKPRQPKSPRRPSLAHNPFARHHNSSQLTLGLSGRPQSRFKFWTSVTADPSNRDSWLESQRKKKRQRTYMCWAFWLCFFALVAGVVVCVLLLKAKKII
ncbi:hypothetical protein BU26DRAFT_506606 [Trematosphaeria pertusa]|uniref:Uncharacterized protein n=1 Tax=Trematosphaeria pertusa TaxID=390896 RepID=A0A6A6IAE2_9PLEO|nr:uncharacterized protein BU26DRAFT_506606 [Trematosphaeria pertusa]KAF2247351.1 hypothetical protein BU26DRAFT_506606 [Trematosphaeria pertusa]